MLAGPEVRIIGGGMIGLSIAWRLQSGGAQVTLFDSGAVGSGASWAAAGMLAPGGEFACQSFWADAAVRSLQIYPRFVAELEELSGLPIDFRRCGAFEIAYTEAEAVELGRRVAEQTTIGIYSEQFPASRVPGVRAGAHAAQYYPHDAVANPRDMLRSLRIAVLRAGVNLKEFAPIQRISETDPFDATVIAAGAWSSLIASPTRAPEVRPVRGHLIAFDEDTGLCDSIIRSGSTYLLRRTGNVVVAGSSTEDASFDRTLDGKVAAGIAGRAGRLVPALVGLNYIAWNGLRPHCDAGPLVQRFEDSNIWLAYGHYRNGILLAPFTAEVIANAIMPASSQTDLPLQGVHLR